MLHKSTIGMLPDPLPLLERVSVHCTKLMYVIIHTDFKNPGVCVAGTI